MQMHRPLRILCIIVIIMVLTLPHLLTKPESIAYSQTTCSPKAFRRGSGQHVVAYSFYTCDGSDPNTKCGTNNTRQRGYLKGIEENLALVTKHYPGYVMRLYIDLAKKDPILEQLRSLEQNVTNLDLCDVKTLPGTPFLDASKVFAMVWRFFPTLDPQVYYDIVADPKTIMGTTQLFYG